MSSAPEISVVMGVYNGAEGLRETICSALSQESVDLEFIVVDDGSVDETAAILREIQTQDTRLRIIHQPNQGLTSALMRGCKEARGKYIARQDAGDISLPGRLRVQAEVLSTHPDVALVSCGARFVGPGGECLYEVTPAGGDASAGLLTLEVGNVRGPAHHGATMFRREWYERVGGYRAQFYFAQDLDLWTRLIEVGRHVALPTMLYQATFSRNSISGIYRRRQLELTRIILDCARLRRARMSEGEVLRRASAVRKESCKPSAVDRASGLYFIGACLAKRSDPRARHYFLDAIRTCPYHIKSVVRLALEYVRG